MVKVLWEAGTGNLHDEMIGNYAIDGGPGSYGSFNIAPNTVEGQP